MISCIMDRILIDAIRDKLDRDNITLYRLQKELGISQPMMSDIFKGRVKPSLEKLIRLSGMIGLKVTLTVEDEE